MLFFENRILNHEMLRCYLPELLGTIVSFLLSKEKVNIRQINKHWFSCFLNPIFQNIVHTIHPDFLKVKQIVTFCERPCIQTVGTSKLDCLQSVAKQIGDMQTAAFPAYSMKLYYSSQIIETKCSQSGMISKWKVPLQWDMTSIFCHDDKICFFHHVDAPANNAYIYDFFGKQLVQFRLPFTGATGIIALYKLEIFLITVKGFCKIFSIQNGVHLRSFQLSFWGASHPLHFCITIMNDTIFLFCGLSKMMYALSLSGTFLWSQNFAKDLYPAPYTSTSMSNDGNQIYLTCRSHVAVFSTQYI